MLFSLYDRIYVCVGEGNGNPLQYSCLENLMDRGGWRATVQGVAKNWTQLGMRTLQNYQSKDKNR